MKQILVILSAIIVSLSVAAQTSKTAMITGMYDVTASRTNVSPVFDVKTKAFHKNSGGAVIAYLEPCNPMIATAKDALDELRDVIETTEAATVDGFNGFINQYGDVQFNKTEGIYTDAHPLCQIGDWTYYVREGCLNILAVYTPVVKRTPPPDAEPGCDPNSWGDVEVTVVTDPISGQPLTIWFQKNQCGEINPIGQKWTEIETSSAYSVSTVRVVGSVSGPKAVNTSSSVYAGRKIKIKNKYGTGGSGYSGFASGFGRPMISIAARLSFTKSTSSAPKQLIPGQYHIGTGNNGVIPNGSPAINTSGDNSNGSPTIGDPSNTAENGSGTLGDPNNPVP